MLELTLFFFLKNVLIPIISLDTHFTDFFDLEVLILFSEWLLGFLCFGVISNCVITLLTFLLFALSSGSHLLHDA